MEQSVCCQATLQRNRVLKHLFNTIFSCENYTFELFAIKKKTLRDSMN